MKIVMSYLIKTEKAIIWLAPGKEIPEDATVIEDRPVLFPEEGLILQNKDTKEQFESIWLCNDDSENNYIEVEKKEESQE